MLLTLSHTMDAAANAAAAFPTRSAAAVVVALTVEMVMLGRLVVMSSGRVQVAVSAAYSPTCKV